MLMLCMLALICKMLPIFLPGFFLMFESDSQCGLLLYFLFFLGIELVCPCSHSHAISGSASFPECFFSFRLAFDKADWPKHLFL